MSILLCNKRGDRRFWDEAASVEVNGVTDTIANHFKKATETDELIIDGHHYEKKYARAFYNLMWVKYLSLHPELVQEASIHHKFVGNSADVIRTYIKESREAVINDKDVVELVSQMKANQPQAPKDASDNTIIIALTGHRPEKLDGYNIFSPFYMELAKQLRSIVLSYINKGKKVHMVSGMALGADTIWALVGLKLKDQGYPVVLEAAIPCANHPDTWKGTESKIRWQNIVDRSDIVTQVSNKPYAGYLMQKRNEYMVNKCNVLVSVWNGTEGGTYNCLSHMVKRQNAGQKIHHINVNPNDVRAKLYQASTQPIHDMNVEPNEAETKVSETDEQFTVFFGHNSPFSQFHIAPFTENEIAFDCMEQYMMYQKAMLMGDSSTASEILATHNNPKQCKKLGRKVKPFNAKLWNEECRNIVYHGNKLKFTQNQHLMDALKSTMGTTLVEASPYDCKWGVGLAASDPQIFDRNQWKGTNWLGECLTQLREELFSSDCIQYVDGDLLKSDCNVILHQANCQSTMGSGIAKTIRETYPDAYIADKNDPRRPLERLGGYSCVTVDGITIFNLYGQLNYGVDKPYTDYDALEKALRACLANITDNAKIGLPYNMGCGKGGGDWKVVEAILRKVAKEMGQILYVYKLK